MTTSKIESILRAHIRLHVSTTAEGYHKTEIVGFEAASNAMVEAWNSESKQQYKAVFNVDGDKVFVPFTASDKLPTIEQHLDPSEVKDSAV